MNTNPLSMIQNVYPFDHLKVNCESNSIVFLYVSEYQFKKKSDMFINGKNHGRKMLNIYPKAEKLSQLG